MSTGGLHRAPELNHAVVNSAAGGTLPIVSGVAGQRAGIYRLVLVVSTTVTVTIQDTNGNALSAPYAFGTSGGSLVLDVQINGDPWYQSGSGGSPVGTGLQINASAAVQVSADVYYLQGP